MAKLGEFQIRDPFIVADPAARVYRLYGTSGLGGPMEAPDGFVMRTSRDLRTWSEPRSVLTRAQGPANADFYWAPEVHFYQGRWYLFGSFGYGMNLKKPGVHYTAIYAANSPDGPFLPHSEGQITPLGWRCIDGTLHVDAQGRPWLVFVREWIQIVDGAILALPLSADLRRALGEPQMLFRASSAAWSLAQPAQSDYGNYDYRVTDGPWLHRTAAGTLLMLWSSFGKGGYLTGVARSLSGEITGPWEQAPAPIYANDGGHPMLFRTLEGRLLMALHAPNRPMFERARFLPVTESADGLALEK